LTLLQLNRALLKRRLAYLLLLLHQFGFGHYISFSLDKLLVHGCKVFAKLLLDSLKIGIILLLNLLYPLSFLLVELLLLLNDLFFLFRLFF